MNSKLNKREREWLGRVKELPCSVCDAPGPSYAHHIEQGEHYTCVALCYECHQGKGGVHGDKTFWRIYKINELQALNKTIEGMFKKLLTV